MEQDPALELAELRPRFDPELAGQPVARLLHRRERVGLAARAVEREHPLGQQALAQGVAADEVVELREQPRPVAAGEIGVDALLHHGQAPLLEPLRLLIRERLVEDVGEGRAAPELERLAQRTARHQSLEAVEVELTRLDDEQVAGSAPQDATCAQHPAQPRHVAVERLRRAPGWMLPPQPGDQPVARHRLVRAEEQHREQCALLRPAERERGAVAARLDRAEDRELHAA